MLVLPIMCGIYTDGQWIESPPRDWDGQELEDCIKDIQIVAIAFGVSCSEPPDFFQQP